LISAILTFELDTLPALLDSSTEAFGCSEGASCIINPHASSLAKLTVFCITAAFREGSGQNEKKRKLLSSSVPSKRQCLDSLNKLPLYRLLDSDSSAFPTNTRPSSSSSMSEDEVKIKTKPEIQSENGVFDSNNGKVAVALIALFDAFLHVLVDDSIDSRILSILEFLGPLLQTSHCHQILPFLPVRLLSKLLSSVPWQMTTKMAMALTYHLKGCGCFFVTHLLFCYLNATILWLHYRYSFYIN